MPSRPKQNKKRLLFLGAAMTCLLATLWAGAWCWAEILAIGPRQQIEHWEAHGLTGNQKTIAQAVAQLTTASQLNSSNAEFYWLRGRLVAMQYNTTNTNDSKLAIKLFQQAIEKRPSWGLPWVYLAQVASQEPANHPIFITALQKAANLEPYEQINQAKIIPLALANWDRLPNALKKTLSRIITHSLQYNEGGTFILEAAAQLNKAEIVAPLITKEWQKRRLKQLVKQRAV